ncbi:MAG: Rho-binding antiterminator [Cocleimonas sp.]
MSYQPIKCELYDYFEVACLYHYKLEIKLLNGEKITGIAQNTRIENKQEFLLIGKKSASQEIRLDKIKCITALDKNAKFNSIKIN